ncbi:MAG: CDP-diacylglycerol--glycerol-3-phosphate 3-phosphatidyltransferase [Propionibacteriaceae bacterium]|nr:CDP-diacylglycerol--glycerol-3-phosphate 3-phosphatidyltransferase [Propionibacteriaceae bacterium]
MNESNTVVPVVNIPNALTVLRLAMVPLFAWMLLSHPDNITWRWMTTAVFIVALLTDLADGAIARRKNLITNFGKLWDPIADKAITGMAMIGLSIIGELWWWVTIVILIREWGITIMRFLIVKYGVQAADRLGKMKTFFQTIALVGLLAPFIFHMEELVSGPWYMVCFFLHWLAIIAMAIALTLTIVSGVNYVLGAWRLRQNYLATHPQDSSPPDSGVKKNSDDQ